MFCGKAYFGADRKEKKKGYRTKLVAKEMATFTCTSVFLDV
jgi:hypothetical protein